MQRDQRQAGGGEASEKSQRKTCERARLLLHPGIRQKCSGSRCLEERGASELQEEEGEGEAGAVVVAEVGKEGCGG